MERSKSLPHNWLGAAFISVCSFSVFLSLGLWQLNRKEWKEKILTRITQQAEVDPIALPSECHWNPWESKIGEYRYVTVHGKFLHHKELLFHTPSPMDGDSENIPGFFVVTPLEQSDGSIVIINRGFIPARYRSSIERYTPPSDRTVTLVGLTRKAEKRGWLMPDNDPKKNEWFIQDPLTIAKIQDLKRVAPFLIDAMNTENTPHLTKWPRGRNKIPSIPNDHLGYACTWFALAGAILVIFTFWIGEQRKAKRTPEPIYP